ncbi:hypothetical protein C8R43DRAFT_984029 [Mycena crocata]|nr:hypothetical protein C8R43DRAFT_984029 [Mycena crocata]
MSSLIPSSLRRHWGYITAGFVAFLILILRPHALPSVLVPGPYSPSQCNDHPCLTLTTGLDVVHAHLRHLIGIWDLVDGLGHPGMTTFVPTAQRSWSPDAYPIGVYRDTTSRDLLKSMVVFAHSTDHMDTVLSMKIISPLVRVFNPRWAILRSLPQMGQTLTNLEQGGTNDRELKMNIDVALNSTIAMLSEQAVAACNVVRDKVVPFLPLAANTTLLGSGLISGIHADSPRVIEALRHLPWWDAWTFSHLAGASDTARFKAYLKFLKQEEQTFRYLAEAASAVHDNLVDLRDYCIWYSDNTTIRMINEDGLVARKSLSVKRVFQDVEYLLTRIKITLSTEHNPENGWPARRVRSRATPWLG